MFAPDCALLVDASRLRNCSCPHSRPPQVHLRQTPHRPPPRNQPSHLVLDVLFILRYAFLAAE
jgi:hypothetical protein